MSKRGYSRVTTQVGASRRGDLFDAACPTRGLLDRVGGKWTAMIVKLLEARDERRFAELARGATGISRKMLSATLRDLERDGLLTRRVEATKPPSVYYRLTPLGVSLAESLAVLRDWAEANMSTIDEARDRFDLNTRGVIDVQRAPAEAGALSVEEA